jgi:hypothetical protein
MSVFQAFISQWPYAFFFNVSQYTCDVIAVPCCMNSTISTPFLSQKTDASSFLTDRQRLFKRFSDYLVNVCASTVSTAVWFQHSQMKSKFHFLLLLQCYWEIRRNLCRIALKSKSRSNSLHFVRTREHFWNPSCTKLVTAYLNHNNIVEKIAWDLWKFTWQFWNCEAPSFIIFFCQHFGQDHHSLLTAGRPLRSSSWHLFAHLWTLYAIVLEFLHPLYFGRKPLGIIHNGFPWRKSIKARISSWQIINRRTQHNSLYRGKNKH